MELVSGDVTASLTGITGSDDPKQHSQTEQLHATQKQRWQLTEDMDGPTEQSNAGEELTLETSNGQIS